MAAVAQVVQDVEEPGTVRGGQAGGGLVEDDEPRACRQGPGDGDQRAVGRCEPGDRCVGVEVGGDDAQGVDAAPTGAAPGDQPGPASVPGGQGDVLGDRHPLHETEVLMDEGHVAGGGGTAEGLPVHRDLPRVGVMDSGEHLDERGLSGPVGTEEGEHAARAHIEVDPGQRDGRAEPLAEPADTDEGLRSEGRSRLRWRVGSVAHSIKLQHFGHFAGCCGSNGPWTQRVTRRRARIRPR